MKHAFDAGLSGDFILDGLSSIMSGFFIYRADDSTDLLYINDAVLDIYDCETEDEFKKLTGRTFKNMILPADHPKVKDQIITQIFEKKSFDKIDFRIRGKKERIKKVSVKGKAFSSRVKGELVAVTMEVVSLDENNVAEAEAKYSIDPAKRQYILDTIDTAVKEEYIKIYYQPKFVTSTGKLCGLEALSRWADPKFGMLLPGEFLPVLEEAKLTYILDRYVMKQVVRDMADRKEKTGKLIPVSFNLSHDDFLEFDPCNELIELATKYDIEREYLQVEISEKTLNSDLNLFKHEIRRFRENDFEVLIDDFGNEHSSLTNIREYEFDGMIIDMGYMENFDDRSKNILKSIINMSKSLGIHTSAKGIEKEEQMEYLKSVGCEMIQGYYYSYGRPSELIPDEFVQEKDPARDEEMDFVEEYAKESTVAFHTKADLSERQRIFDAISSIYNSIYVLDLEKDVYKELRANYALHRFLGATGRISKVLPAIMRTFTTEEYLEPILYFTDPETLAERLSTRDFIKSDFMGAVNGWTTAAFFVLDRDADGKAKKILFTTRIIDASKKTEMDYKDVLYDISKIYFGLMHIIFNSGEFIPLIMPTYLRERLGMKQQPYELAKEMFVKNYVSSDYQQKVNEFIDLPVMRERLKETPVISMEYYGNDKKWYRIVISSSRTDENGNVLRASLAMEDINQEKNEQEVLEFKIEHDALTGVLNRNAYEKYTELLKNSDMAIAYILLDVDKFKQINDTYGHGVGDSVLKKLARYMRNEFRLSDHIIRMGGDEFCVIMTGIEHKDAQMIMDKIDAINDAMLTTGNSEMPKVSISAGIAFSEQGFTVDLYKKADVALYHTKNTQRGGYTIYDDLADGSRGGS